MGSGLEIPQHLNIEGKIFCKLITKIKKIQLCSFRRLELLMKKNYLYLILFIFIISINLCYCNEEQKKNSNIDELSDEKIVENNNDKTKVKNSDTVEKVTYYDKEKLEKWSNNFLRYLKNFSDREIKEKKLVREGKRLIETYDQYWDLYDDLKDIQKLYNEKVENPPKKLPKVAYDTLKVCKNSYNEAMSKRIKSIESMILFIDSLRKKEIENEKGVIDSANNEALNNYQQYTIDYDEIIKKIVIALKDIYMKLGYEMNFSEGKITKAN